VTAMMMILCLDDDIIEFGIVCWSHLELWVYVNKQVNVQDGDACQWRLLPKCHGPFHVCFSHFSVHFHHFLAHRNVARDAYDVHVWIPVGHNVSIRSPQNSPRGVSIGTQPTTTMADYEMDDVTAPPIRSLSVILDANRIHPRSEGKSV
jgi:hypothetical protein